mgnify:CR=1 FL=1
MRHSLRTTSISILAAAALAACGGGGKDETSDYALTGTYAAEPAKPAAESKPVPVEGCTVEMYGDSIMAGNGSAETPAMTLQRLRPGLQIVADHSAAGTTLSMLYASFPASPRTARYVVIENGVIDAWQGVAPQPFLNTYSVMVERLRSEGRVPVLTGFARQTGPIKGGDASRRDPYDAVVKSFANESGVAFADWGDVPFNGAADLLDFVHPSKGYSDRLIEKLAETLDRIAPECVQ